MERYGAEVMAPKDCVTVNPADSALVLVPSEGFADAQVGSDIDCLVWATLGDRATAIQANPAELGVFTHTYHATIGSAVIPGIQISKYVVDTWFHVSPIAASGQMPVSVLSVNENFPVLGYVTGSFCAQTLITRDDHGLVSPSVHQDLLPRLAFRSLGDIVEPHIRYLRQLDEVTELLHVRRGNDSQEHFMFDVVAPFIARHGAAAIRDIDILLGGLPPSARYSFPYLLGHLRTNEQSILRARVAYLAKYSGSSDADIREGALEALDHLNAA